MKYYDDCGTRYGCASCPNCYEEVYINDYQMPEFPIAISKEWVDTVNKQKKR